MQQVILPYIEDVKDGKDLPLKQHTLCIFDVFMAHQGETLRQQLYKHNVHVVEIPQAALISYSPLISVSTEHLSET